METRDLEAVARQVIRGNYGNGEERKKRLRELGIDSSEVQKIVNSILKGTYTPVDKLIKQPNLQINPLLSSMQHPIPVVPEEQTEEDLIEGPTYNEDGEISGYIQRLHPIPESRFGGKIKRRYSQGGSVPYMEGELAGEENQALYDNLSETSPYAQQSPNIASALSLNPNVIQNLIQQEIIRLFQLDPNAFGMNPEQGQQQVPIDEARFGGKIKRRR